MAVCLGSLWFDISRREREYGMCGILVQCGQDRGRRVRGGLGDEIGAIKRRREIEVVAVVLLGFG